MAGQSEAREVRTVEEGAASGLPGPWGKGLVFHVGQNGQPLGALSRGVVGLAYILKGPLAVQWRMGCRNKEPLRGSWGKAGGGAEKQADSACTLQVE